jgi:aldose 1-epimerase
VITLNVGEQQATVDTVGAGLRDYRVGARAVLDGCAPGQPCTAARGNLLVPWPNRITDATYRFAGVEHRLPVTEPATGAAIHGLTRRKPWRVVEHSDNAVTLRYELAAQPGYPFALRCEVEYRLGRGGLRVRTGATNTGAEPAPYATGAHPYLAAGPGRIDELIVRVPAAHYYPTDHRGTPSDRRPVDGTGFDLRDPVLLGDRRIDHAYTGLHRDGDGLARAWVRTPDDVTVVLWLGAGYDYVQLFTGDSVPEPERRRRGIAVEPMTAAPDAFRTGDGLRVLSPGQGHIVEWGIELPSRAGG